MLIWDGRYKIERTLGEGGMGQVFLARDLAMEERTVALKLLLPEFSDATAEFMREYVLQRRLRHPSIPQVWDFGFGRHSQGEVPYFAMEYVPGVSLARALHQMKAPRDAWPWVIDVLRGLDHLHNSGFLHRDLKPGNILVQESYDPAAGTGPAAQLIDYGIAIPIDATPEELFIGTPEYSAPELMAGDPFDVRQDLYAIGLLLYEIVAGRRPWDQEDPTELWEQRTYGSYAPLRHPDCSVELALLIDDLLRVNVARRPANAAEVLIRFVDAVGHPCELETTEAFRMRLDALPFGDQPHFQRAARDWHAGLRVDLGDDERPAILMVDAPSGHDGRAFLHELTDRGAVGGSRVLRIELNRSRYAPLEPLQPALAVFKRLRESRAPDAFIPSLAGMAGAATMLTRLHGPTILAIEGLQRADAATLEVLATVFSGAANAKLRVIASVDPDEAPAAPDAFERLTRSRYVRRVSPVPLTHDPTIRWITSAIGQGSIESGYAERLFEKAEGRPGQIRALMTEDYSAGHIQRLVDGFEIQAFPSAESRTEPDSRDVAFVDLLSVLEDPLPEAALRTYLAEYVDYLPYLLGDGTFVRHDSGLVGLGRTPSHAPEQTLTDGMREALLTRLAESLSAAPAVAGQAAMVARAWLRTNQPELAIPYLVAASNMAAEQLQAEVADGHLERARNLVRATPAGEPGRWEYRVQIERSAARIAQLTGNVDRWWDAASDLFQLGLDGGHVQTMKDALEAFLPLDVERRDWRSLMRHATSRRALEADPPHPDGLAFYSWAEAQTAWAKGDLTELIEATERGLLTDHGQPRASVMLMLLGLQLDALVTMEWAREGSLLLDRFEALLRPTGGAADRARAALCRARMLRMGNAPGDALHAARSMAAELGDRRIRGVNALVELELAQSHAEFHWFTTALDHADRAWRLAREGGDELTALWARLVEVRVVATMGHLREAVQLLAELEALVPADLHISLALELRYTRISLALTDADADGAQQLCTAAEKLAADAMRHYARGVAVRGVALAAEAMQLADRVIDAVTLAERALTLSEAFDGVGAARHTLLFTLARATYRAGDAEQSTRILNQAKKSLRENAAGFVDPDERRQWLELPLNLAIGEGRLIVETRRKRARSSITIPALNRPRVAVPA